MHTRQMKWRKMVKVTFKFNALARPHGNAIGQRALANGQGLTGHLAKYINLKLL